MPGVWSVEVAPRVERRLARPLAGVHLRVRPWRVAVLVLAVHAVWIVAYFAAGHQVRDFIKIGPNYVRRSHASSVIRYDPHYAYPQNHELGAQGQGYDGQFSYYIALDPSRARFYTDAPSYRYERILYPILARVTALTRPGAVPWTMLVINWLAVGLGVLALAAWLGRKGVSPAYALIYGLFPGLLVGLQRDLTEPLAYALVAVAIYLFDFGGRRGVILSACAFALAALTRETTLIFALAFGASILAGRPNASGPPADRGARRRQAALFAAVAVVPIAAWTGFVWSWLGLPEAGTSDITAPFLGAFQVPFAAARQPVDAVMVVLPALLACGVALAGARQAGGWTERLCLVANALFMVVLASGKVWNSYTSIGRISVAIVLAALICLPYVKWRRRTTQAALAAAALWLVMIPVVVYYGFATIKV